MYLTATLDEMTEAQLLDHADEVSRTQRKCEAQVLRIAAQTAVLNSPETIDPDVARLPGRERVVRFGGVGTPDVAEFAAAALGARLEISSGSARSLMADALDLMIRLPQLWRRVEALEVKASYARFVARRTRNLTPDQASYVDERVAEPADGRIPWSRFEDLVAGLVVASDPEAAAEAEQASAQQQVARPTRSTEDGMRGFFIRAPVPVVALLDGRVQWIADVLRSLGDTDGVEERRVKAVAVLADPHRAVALIEEFAQWRDGSGERPDVDWSSVMPAITLHVHTYAGPEPTDTVRVEGHGPVTGEWVRRHLGPHARFTIRPVLDIAGQAPVDAYEIPERHRQAVHLMTPADTFPWGVSTTRHHQIDHTVPYRRDGTTGQSRVGNYGPMSAFHHRLKTHGKWQVHQPVPGIYFWRDPYGATYVVDHSGTRRLPAPEPPSPAERAVARALFGLAA
ncbi:DUF222 domain-containing protein [Nocardioides currus]|uniref:DUF222 domain-containing protein n=1 Tax=Nocardioides currus TaxID=2133958 RepID=A0A2R7Z0K9_9ACTN|nr:DUF222 domain-containing protein [Nocardioides currus]PUA81806.1 hypothetical protein C7S10_07005 [Nocardioides currus]